MLDPSVFSVCRSCEMQTPQAALYCSHCWTFKAARLGWGSVAALVLAPFALVVSLTLWKSPMQIYWALSGVALTYLSFYFKKHAMALAHTWLFLGPVSLVTGALLFQPRLADFLVTPLVLFYGMVALVTFAMIATTAIEKGHSRWEVTVAVGSASLSLYFLFYEAAVTVGWLPPYGEELARFYWVMRIILMVAGVLALVVGAALRLSRKALRREYARLNPITKLAAYTHAFVVELWQFTKETFGTFLKIQIRLITALIVPLAVAGLAVYLANLCSLAVFGYLAQSGFVNFLLAALWTVLFWASVMFFSFLLYAADVHQFEEIMPPYLQLTGAFFPAVSNDTLILSWHLTYLLPATQALTWILGKTFGWKFFSPDFGYFSILGALVFIALAVHGARRPNALHKTA